MVRMYESGFDMKLKVSDVEQLGLSKEMHMNSKPQGNLVAKEETWQNGDGQPLQARGF